MHSLSRRALIMLTGSFLVSAIVLVVIYGAHGAPAVESIKSEHRPDGPAEAGASHHYGDELYAGDYELKQVHVVFRHGQRTPADTYPNDPLINQTFAPYGWGQLTNYGKQSLYDIGDWLRHRYSNLLGSLFSPNNIFAQSTGVSRTQMAIELVLASLYPPAGTALEWNRNLNWQPIPFISEPLDQDSLLLVRISCPRYHEALDAVLNSDTVKKIMADNTDLLQNLTKITGLNIKTADDVQSLYSTLRAESEFGLKLPTWTKDYYPNQLLPLTEQSYIFNVYNDELKKLKGGPLLKKTISEWDAVIANENNPNNKKMFLYAGHDSTVVNILSAFNVWREQFPSYGIMAIFELHKNRSTGQFAVRIYQKEIGMRRVPLTIPGCDTYCPVNQLKVLLSSHVPKDMVQDCKAQQDGFEEPPPKGP